MNPEFPLLLVLDLTGTFVFGLNGALTAVRAARLDIVGVRSRVWAAARSVTSSSAGSPRC